MHDDRKGNGQNIDKRRKMKTQGLKAIRWA